MPIRSPQMDVADYGRAIGQGNQNALAQAQMMNAGQQMQQRNALAPIQQQQAQANLASTQLKSESDKTKFLTETLQTMVDEPSWKAGYQRLVGAGMPEDSLPRVNDQEYRSAVLAKLSGKDTGFTLSPGQQRFSATGEPIASVPKETTPVGAIDPIAPWAKVRDPKKLDEARMRFGMQADAKAQKMIDEAEQSRSVISNLERFVQLNESNTTGAGYDIPIIGSIASSTAAAMNPEFQEMKSISDRLTPAMRQGMPGAASDRDVAMFRGATVGIGKSKEANKNVALGLIAANQNKIDRANFYSQYIDQRGHDRGAEQEWRKYLNSNPIFDPKAGKGSYTLNPNRLTYDEYADPEMRENLLFTAKKNGMTVDEVRKRLQGQM